MRKQLLLSIAMLSIASPITADANIEHDNQTVVASLTQIRDEFNTLPVGDVTWQPTSSSDYTRLLQEKRKLIAEKIASVTNINKQMIEEHKRSLEQNKTNEQSHVDELQYDSRGLLVMDGSGNAQVVVNRLLAIPGHRNGATYHANGLDDLINTLTTSQAVWVVHRIEGAGFGQTGDGYAGVDSPTNHRNFVTKQINRRFGGSVHALLRAWGTYNYGGY